MSKSTQNSATAKTKSARKTYVRYGLVALAVLALILPFFFVGQPTVTLESGGRSYRLEIVSTAESQEKGLGGRRNMASDRGMIFVFDPPAVQCFWMKDMQFPLDIIWLNSAKKVTKVAANVSPSTYPEKYCGDDTTKYVIELNAGEAKKAGIVPGVTVKL
jgi:uncharacterized membrane protein (UPF0127 family)